MYSKYPEYMKAFNKYLLREPKSCLGSERVELMPALPTSWERRLSTASLTLCSPFLR